MSFQLSDYELQFWLDEYERYLLRHPAGHYVDPNVHNMMVRALLNRLATERKTISAYERSVLPIREALEVH